jgi:hypothetical protein
MTDMPLPFRARVLDLIRSVFVESSSEGIKKFSMEYVKTIELEGEKKEDDLDFGDRSLAGKQPSSEESESQIDRIKQLTNVFDWISQYFEIVRDKGVREKSFRYKKADSSRQGTKLERYVVDAQQGEFLISVVRMCGSLLQFHSGRDPDAVCIHSM